MASPDAALVAAAPDIADELVGIGETILEIWLAAHGKTPTRADGRRASACWRFIARAPGAMRASTPAARPAASWSITAILFVSIPCIPTRRGGCASAAMVARHLALFIGGKLEVAGLGEFCCSSRPLRQHETNTQPEMALNL